MPEGTRSSRHAATGAGQSVRWSGRCPACGEWNSLVEREARSVTGRDSRVLGQDGRSRPWRRWRRLGSGSAAPWCRLGWRRWCRSQRLRWRSSPVDRVAQQRRPERGRTERDRVAGTRSGARRRSGTRICDSSRRGAGGRQVHFAPPGPAIPGGARVRTPCSCLPRSRLSRCGSVRNGSVRCQTACWCSRVQMW